MFILLKVAGATDVSAIELPEDATANMLCQLIQIETGIPLQSQYITFNSLQVPNTTIPLRALGIVEGSELNGKF